MKDSRVSPFAQREQASLKEILREKGLPQRSLRDLRIYKKKRMGATRRRAAKRSGKGQSRLRLTSLGKFFKFSRRGKSASQWSVGTLTQHFKE